MLKVYDYAITLAEFPDEVALCLNISNCPCRCEGCSEKYLWDDVGEELTISKLDKIIEIYKEKGITLIGFMGGDADPIYLGRILEYLKHTYDLKTGFYSGRDYIDLHLAPYLDYYKIGRFIQPQGDVQNWHKRTNGPIIFPWSNQKMYKKVDHRLVDITDRFRQNPVSALDKYILKEDE